MIVDPKQLELYETQEGDTPYLEWFESLGDSATRKRIDARIRKVRGGNLGPRKSVGGGVVELIEDFGPGYRIYIGQMGTKIVILLCGGDKRTQEGDIKDARAYWADYKYWLKEEEKDGSTK